jgi:hypothetical protein
VVSLFPALIRPAQKAVAARRDAVAVSARADALTAIERRTKRKP